MEYLKKYQSILERPSLFGSIPSDELQALLGCLAVCRSCRRIFTATGIL